MHPEQQLFSFFLQETITETWPQKLKSYKTNKEKTDFFVLNVKHLSHSNTRKSVSGVYVCVLSSESLLKVW